MIIIGDLAVSISFLINETTWDWREGLFGGRVVLSGKLRLVDGVSCKVRSVGRPMYLFFVRVYLF